MTRFKLRSGGVRKQVTEGRGKKMGGVKDVEDEVGEVKEWRMDSQRGVL